MRRFFEKNFSAPAATKFYLKNFNFPAKKLRKNTGA